MMSKASMALEKGLEEANLPERLTKLDEANRSMKLEIAGKDLELTMLRRQLKQEEDKWSAKAMMKDRELEEANQSSKRKTSEKDRQLTRIRKKLTAFKLILFFICFAILVFLSHSPSRIFPCFECSLF